MKAASVRCADEFLIRGALSNGETPDPVVERCDNHGTALCRMTHPNPPRRRWSSRAHKGFQHACAAHLETLAPEPKCPTECAA